MDPIIVTDDLSAYDSGVLPNPNEISDHSATYIVLPHDYSVSSTYIRRVWSYKRADFTKLEENIRSFDWGCLSDGTASSLDDTNAVLPPFIEHTDQVLEHITVTEEEINDVIVNLDPNKASGPDLISNKMIKNVSRAIVKPLCILFNRSLREGVFPDIWKLGNLVPLFKKPKYSSIWQNYLI